VTAGDVNNPDFALVHRFIKDNPGPLPVVSNPLGETLRAALTGVDAATGRVTLRFEPGPQFLQGNGVIQGGVVAAMLDFAMAFAAHAKAPANSVGGTMSMNVNFLRPALPGAYIGTGRVTRLGTRVAFLDSELARETDGAVVATATSVMALNPAAGGR
jgi:uncharacterized protein (TIGR00369 family)